MIQSYLDKLSFQFKESVNLKALLTAHLSDFEDNSVAFDTILTDTTLNGSVGVQLDKVGNIVGLERPINEGVLLDDDSYRILIKVKIQANKTSMTNEDVIEMISFALDGAVVRYILQANLEPTYEVGQILTDFQINVILPLIPTLIGNSNVVYKTMHNNTPFGFSDDPTALGFGDINDSNVGGNFPTLIL